MYYCGLDLHAKSSVFCCVNRRGGRVFEEEVLTSRRGFALGLAGVKGKAVKVVVEASTRTAWAVGVLSDLGADVTVVDPRKVRVIAETKHKTDRTDARILADLLRTGALPLAVWQAPQATRRLRDQVRMRWGLVQARTRLVLRARSALAGVGISLGPKALNRSVTLDRVLASREVPGHVKRLLEILRAAVEELTRVRSVQERIVVG